jgi:hypothetical protein
LVDAGDEDLAAPREAGEAVNHDPATGHEDGSVVGCGDSIETQVASQEGKIGERFGASRMSLLRVSYYVCVGRFV